MLFCLNRVISQLPNLVDYRILFLKQSVKRKIPFIIHLAAPCYVMNPDMLRTPTTLSTTKTDKEMNKNIFAITLYHKRLQMIYN